MLCFRPLQAVGAIIFGIGKLGLFPALAGAIDTFERLPPSFEEASTGAVHAKAEKEEFD